MLLETKTNPLAILPHVSGFVIKPPLFFQRFCRRVRKNGKKVTNGICSKINFPGLVKRRAELFGFVTKATDDCPCLAREKSLHSARADGTG